MNSIDRRPVCVLALSSALLVASCAIQEPPETQQVLDEALPETTVSPEAFGGEEVVDSGAVDDGWIQTFGDP